MVKPATAIHIPFINNSLLFYRRQYLLKHMDRSYVLVLYIIDVIGKLVVKNKPKPIVRLRRTSVCLMLFMGRGIIRISVRYYLPMPRKKCNNIVTLRFISGSFNALKSATYDVISSVSTALASAIP